ncbi:MAG: hypothetical protein ACI81P_003422, partial [Neolewinella sp.]
AKRVNGRASCFLSLISLFSKGERAKRVNGRTSCFLSLISLFSLLLLFAKKTSHDSHQPTNHIHKSNAYGHSYD